MSTLFSDVRVGLRMLRRDKVFTTTAVLTLAVCIGANAALFSVVRGVLLKPLAMPEAERVVMAGNVYPGAGVHEPIGSAVPDYFDRLRQTTVFESQAMFAMAAVTVDMDDRPQRAQAMVATPSLFRVMSVPPGLGRAFDDTEDELGRAKGHAQR